MGTIVSDSEATPEVNVVSGSPTPEELAAILTVVSMATASVPTEPPRGQPRAGGWKSYWRSIRAPFHHGPGGWRTV